MNNKRTVNRTNNIITRWVRVFALPSLALVAFPVPGRTAGKGTKGCIYEYVVLQHGHPVTMSAPCTNNVKLDETKSGNQVQMNSIICGYFEEEIECGKYPTEAGE